MNDFPIISLGGMQITALRRVDLIDHISAQLQQGLGGWLVTANLDFLARFARDPDAQRLYGMADLTVADGMPLLWAARIQGNRLPERVTGADVVLDLAERAARMGYSIFLLGGADGVAEEARDSLRKRWPDLEIAGVSAPKIDSPATKEQIDEIAEQLRQSQPDIVYVALGSPKQEQLIDQLRSRLPQAWFMGVGMSLGFLAGQVSRAPIWMQTTGLEWLHRLAQEPERLARRYILEDLPYLVRLLVRSWRERTSKLPTDVQPGA